MIRRCVQCNAPVDTDGFLCAACAAGQPLLRPPLPSPVPDVSAVEPIPETPSADARAGCAHCGAAFVEADYPTPLCTACRDTLSRRPVPVGIRMAAAIIGLVVLVSFARFPGAVRAGVAYARGQKAEAAGDNDRAAAQYLVTVKQYPRSTLALARLGLSCYKAGDYDDAGAAFNELGGRKTDAALADEVNAAITDMDAKADAADKAAALQKAQSAAPIVLKAPAPAAPAVPVRGPLANADGPRSPIPVGGFRPGDPRLRTRFVPMRIAPGTMTSPVAPPVTGETGTGLPPSSPSGPQTAFPPAQAIPQAAPAPSPAPSAP